MKSSTSTGRSSKRLLRIRRMMGKSRPRRRMRLMSAAVLPSRPFLPQSTIMHPIAALVYRDLCVLWTCPGHNGGVFYGRSPIGRVFMEHLGEAVFRDDLDNSVL